MIKAVIFDFGQTLVDSAKGFKLAEKIAKEKIFSSLFSDKDKYQNFVAAYRKIRTSFHARSDFSRYSIWKAVYKKFDTKADHSKLEQMETQYWELVKSYTKPFPETIEVLEKLSKQFKLGLITNTQGQKTLSTHRLSLFPDIEKFFQTIVIAGESDLPPKPDSKPFLLCIKKMKIKPYAAIYVGDDFQKDIIGAKNAGLQPIWLKHSLVKRSWHEADKAKTSVKIITNLKELQEAGQSHQIFSDIILKR